MKEKFLEFLETKRIKDRFFANYNPEFRNSPDSGRNPVTIEEYFDKIPPIYYISNAFPWSATEQGSGFWAVKEEEWLKNMFKKRVHVELEEQL